MANDNKEKIIIFFNELEKEELKALAYPNTEYIPVAGQRDINKWINIFKQIYLKQKEGIANQIAIKQLTYDWNPTEIYDFTNWIKFYKENNHIKYKTAQNYYINDGMPGYFVPNNKPIIQQEQQPQTDVNYLKKIIDDEDTHIADRQKQKEKILSRLQAAKKILSKNRKIFNDDEYDKLISSLLDLEKQVLNLKKKSCSLKTYEDLIIRKANILDHCGYKDASIFLEKIADATPIKDSSSDSSESPPAPSLAPPSVPPPASPQMSSVTSASPPPILDDSSSFNDLKDDSGSKSKAISNFMKNFKLASTNNLKYTEEIILNYDDHDDDLFLSEAQIVDDSKKQSLVTDKDPKINLENKEISNFNLMFDSVFSKVKVKDVIEKLEELSNIFKIREIPRQLAIIDIMLDSLGFASFFPSLSEAANKSLESNNYISSRIEDILSRLKGAIKQTNLNLLDESAIALDPESDTIKETIKQQLNKEKEQKQLKKEINESYLPSIEKENPEINLKKDLEEPQIQSVPKSKEISTPEVKQIPILKEKQFPVIPPSPLNT